MKAFYEPTLEAFAGATIGCVLKTAPASRGGEKHAIIGIEDVAGNMIAIVLTKSDAEQFAAELLALVE